MHFENPPLWDGLGDVRIPTPDLNWQEEACVLAGSVPANAAASRNRAVPVLLLVLPIISRLPTTVEVGFDSRKASLRGEKIEKENN